MLFSSRPRRGSTSHAVQFAERCHRTIRQDAPDEPAVGRGRTRRPALTAERPSAASMTGRRPTSTHGYPKNSSVATTPERVGREDDWREHRRETERVVVERVQRRRQRRPHHRDREPERERKQARRGGLCRYPWRRAENLGHRPGRHHPVPPIDLGLARVVPRTAGVRPPARSTAGKSRLARWSCPFSSRAPPVASGRRRPCGWPRAGRDCWCAGAPASRCRPW